MKKISNATILKECGRDFTCSCGLHVHPDHPLTNSKAIHIKGCRFAPKAVPKIINTAAYNRLQALKQHILKELSLTEKEFHKLFPAYAKLIRKEELNSIGKRARFARFQIIGR